MNNRAGLFFLGISGFLGISCGKDEAKNAADPIEIVNSARPQLPAPPVPPTEDNAKSNVLNLAPLPVSGVPSGYSSWDEFNMESPESRSLIILDGSDPAQDLLGGSPLCSIFILSAYLNEQGQATYVLRTSFRHNKQTHGWISISLDLDSTRVIGKGMNGQDQIFLQLAQAGDVLSAERMNLKWFHINHFDTGVCENLQRRNAN
jgi:hypothetical protein